jgi:ankyrin repeat protein
LDTLKFLLESGATLSKGALSKAAASGRRDIVEFLIDKGADVNELFVDEGDYQATPLILASAAGHLEVVQLLLLKGADPLIKDSDDKTAVDLAGGAHGEEITKLLRTSDKKKSTAK